MTFSEPHIVCSVNPNVRFYSASELQQGMTVRPVRGYSLEWTLQSPWWTHVVERVEEDVIYFVRPYAIMHYGTALLGCERYSICRDSTQKFIRMSD